LKDQIGGDLNIAAASLLQDLALLQPNERSRFGYKRAAKALAAGIDRPIADLIAEGTFREIPCVGAATERVAVELVQTGASPTVDRAVESSPRRTEVEKRRRFRRAYLSRYAMRLAMDARLPASVVSRARYLGDLQMHSTWSDGVETIAGLAEGAAALGWRRIGVTDHSYGLPIARGMSMDAVRRQHREIDALNEELAGRVRVYKGVEANILADGSLDLQADERPLFDYVIASPHSALRSGADQTARMLGAVSLPGVAILGHPQGRMYNNRPGVTADWRRVFREAAARDVAIEIDGNWYRQDVDYELAAIATAEGCLFALDSDAHSLSEFAFTDYAIAIARIAAIPAERVVNCWDDPTFDAWLDSRRAGTRADRPRA
jgi:histidinol phosphatase-like PHP family hydrolase